jgi:hypothetical protein
MRARSFLLRAGALALAAVLWLSFPAKSMAQFGNFRGGFGGFPGGGFGGFPGGLGGGFGGSRNYLQTPGVQMNMGYNTLVGLPSQYGQLGMGGFGGMGGLGGFGGGFGYPGFGFPGGFGGGFPGVGVPGKFGGFGGFGNGDHGL